MLPDVVNCDDAARRGQKANLSRLLDPRHIVFFGGQNIAPIVANLHKSGFNGEVWLVNPYKREINGLQCYPSVQDLPAVPDVAFIAVPAEPAIDIVHDLNEVGASGAVVYASGFAESGAEGARLQQRLVEAAGDMAVLGPNCYGLIDGLHGAALWPVAHGAPDVDQGVAILTQSGNMAYNLSMTDRGLPFAYLISVGNQAMVDVAALVEALLDEPRVKAIGMHLEGLKDVPAFCRAAARALECGVPIVALKVGNSDIGAEIARGHTSSLAGTSELYDALFKRLGITRVDDPVALMETLKMLALEHIPQGNRLGALTTSGGEAGMVADLCEQLDMELPRLSDRSRARIAEALPAYANLANPLDITTTPWGDRHALGVCCDAIVADQCDAGVFVLDYPKEESGGRPDCDMAVDALTQALEQSEKPGAIISVFPELLPPAVAWRLSRAGVAPLQGLREGMAAVRAGMRYGVERKRILASDGGESLALLPVGDMPAATQWLDEWQSKDRLRSYGVPVPEGVVTAPGQAPEAAERLGFPVCVKVVEDGLLHKSDIGAVEVNIHNRAELESAVRRVCEGASGADDGFKANRVLVERMAPKPVAELIVGVKQEPNFGLALVIGAGGVLVEFVRDSATLLLPTNEQAIRDALLNLKISKLLNGYRGGVSADIDAAVRAIGGVARFAMDHVDSIVELDVNPLFLHDKGVVAVDALIRMAKD